MSEYKWGVVGTGYVAGNFAESIQYAKNAGRAAVVGRSMDKAGKFAEKYGFEAVYDDYDSMLRESQVDIVYIALPNNLHYEFVMKALDAGKHVLCEKPAADNARQFREMIGKAREKGLFFMEGMWTRCFPAVRKVRSTVRARRLWAKSVGGRLAAMEAKCRVQRRSDTGRRHICPCARVFCVRMPSRKNHLKLQAQGRYGHA